MTIIMNSNIVLKNHLDFLQKLLFKAKLTSVNSGKSIYQKFKFDLPETGQTENIFEILTTDNEDSSTSIRFVFFEKDKKTMIMKRTETRKLFLHETIDFLKKLNSELYKGMTVIEFTAFIKAYIKSFNEKMEKEDDLSFKLMRQHLILPISEMVEEDEFFNVLKWAKRIDEEPESQLAKLLNPDETKRLKLILSLD